MEPATALTIGGLVIACAGLLLLHVFRGPKEQDALLRKDLDRLRDEFHEIRLAHHELDRRVNRDFHDKAEIRAMFTQIDNRLTEVLRHVEPRNVRAPT